MANSTLCRRIVRSYLNFLDSGERSSLSDDEAFRYLLSDVMSSYASSNVNDPVNSKTSEASQTLGDTDEQDPVTENEDELFVQFGDALQKGHYFSTTQNEVEVAMQTAWMFEGSSKDLKKSGCSEFNFQNMADTFKIKGNKCMERNLYTDAIGHYTAAIALFDANAVYYCNRAAAYPQDKQYTDAINDCHKAIEIDPSYSKAYSRLGFAYRAQGNYMDAIEKGYKKALELDPNNETIKGNIRDAERKYMEADTFHVSSGLKDLDSMSPETIQSLFEYEDPRNPVTASEIELFYQFRDALEKARFFGNTPIEATDVQFQAVWMFEGALQELKKSGVSEFDLQKIADTFKLKGNRSMEKKLYTDAIGHYTAAIALFDNNVVYYCNRAAAFTQAKLYTEAIFDCFKALAIDPSYSKAYSRLGFAYHAQGNYMDAIEKGYKKALQLDPDNETIKGNIKAAEKKLMEKLGSAFEMFYDVDGTQDHPHGN
ncbi:hsp70-Hsp90 organizing protein 1-like [Rutidosis leptorrhynchoides]|uniref:hsp70-Hsp90 organizing protein 1-like n=1 Tax=Rutidosis leptorrhynchoides TaxID=125765 RepID=UPI003A994474